MVLEYPTNVLELIINYSIICISNFLMSAYVFYKSQGIRLKTKHLLYLIFSGSIVTGVFVIVRMNNYYYAYFCLFSLSPLLLSFFVRERGKPFNNIVSGLVSLTLVTSIKVIAHIIYGTILWIFKINPRINPSSNYIYLPSEFIAFILCILFMNIKRFRKGFQFFQEEKALGLGLALLAIVMILKCINLRDNRGKIYLYVIFVIGIIIAGFGLFLWIRRSITAHQRERMQLKSEEHYKEVLEERDKEIEKLNQSNAYLAKIVHRDNHLMSNVNTSIGMYFNSDDKADKETLLRELQTLAKKRNEVINKEQLESKLLPSTGNLLIDGAVNDLYIKAAAHGIAFNLTVTSTVDEIIGKYISQTDLQTLLCDHIKDAIIAVDSYGESGGKILVNLSKLNDNYCIDIYDSGVAFETATLSKLGVDRVTTHADSGGSGIGFMTTFETIKKAYASLIITEFEHRSPFSKSVSFRFDGESAFIINSYRKDELQQLINRNDVIFL